MQAVPAGESGDDNEEDEDRKCLSPTSSTESLKSVKTNSDIADAATKAFEVYLRGLPHQGQQEDSDNNLTTPKDKSESEDEVNYPTQLPQIHKKKICIGDDDDDSEDHHHSRNADNCIVNEPDTPVRKKGQRGSGLTELTTPSRGGDSDNPFNSPNLVPPPPFVGGSSFGSALPGTMFRLRFIGSLEVEEEFGVGKKEGKGQRKLWWRKPSPK